MQRLASRSDRLCQGDIVRVLAARIVWRGGPRFRISAVLDEERLRRILDRKPLQNIGRPVDNGLA
jgi:hypothetical protein